ncbi:MAG: polysaccharide deacetylase family protein [Gaiellaceae bacterium]
MEPSSFSPARLLQRLRQDPRARTVAARLPPAARDLLRRVARPDPVRWGNLRRTRPFSERYGFDRGTPIDRYYLERFLAGHAGDVRGSVLEVRDSRYTHRFGGESVEASEVLDIDPRNVEATLVADLAEPGSLPARAFDCFVLVQTLHAGRRVRIDVRTAGSRRRAHESVYRRLRHLPDEAVEQVLSDVGRQFDGGARAMPDLLSDDQLRVLAAHPLFEVGAHTLTHSYLPTLTAAAKLDEAAGAKRLLEPVVGPLVRACSYPHGGYDRETIAAAAAAGYELACSSDLGRARACACRGTWYSTGLLPSSKCGCGRCSAALHDAIGRMCYAFPSTGYHDRFVYW